MYSGVDNYSMMSYDDQVPQTQPPKIVTNDKQATSQEDLKQKLTSLFQSQPILDTPKGRKLGLVWWRNVKPINLDFLKNKQI